MNGLKDEPVWRSAWVARLKAPEAETLRPPTMARTAPSALITTIAACASEPGATRSSKTCRSAFSVAVWMRGSSVVRITTSSVVSRVKNSGPVSITQSAK